MNQITIVANSGRSGSTFLANLLRKSTNGSVYVAHEDIPVQISKPRIYNRAYSADRLSQIMQDDVLISYIAKWERVLLDKPIIETGWTAYHLLPVMKYVFKDNLRIIVLHRDPWSVALSRANMGNYHPNTFYDGAHEVSPFDAYSIAPEFSDHWGEMNHVEKCFYWWYVCYKEIFEFLDEFNDVDRNFVATSDLHIQSDEIQKIVDFVGINRIYTQPEHLTISNEVSKFSRETFPIFDEWKKLTNHQEIEEFAFEKFFYKIDYESLVNKAKKYRLPRGIGPWIRYRTNYWKKKAQIKNLFYKTLSKQAA